MLKLVCYDVSSGSETEDFIETNLKIKEEPLDNLNYMGNDESDKIEKEESCQNIEKRNESVTSQMCISETENVIKNSLEKNQNGCCEIMPGLLVLPGASEISYSDNKEDSNLNECGIETSKKNIFSKYRNFSNSELIVDESASSDGNSTVSLSDEEDYMEVQVETIDILNTDEIFSQKKKQKKNAKLKNHLCDLEIELPPIEDLQISIQENEAKAIGNIFQIIKTQVVIQAYPDIPAIDIDSVLFLNSGRRALGKVFEIFGPVFEPLYIVRFNSNEHVKKQEIAIGDIVYFAPSMDHTSYIVLDELMNAKGSDASWEDDKEPPQGALQFSDDEEERAARRRIKMQKKALRQEENESSNPFQSNFSDSPKRQCFTPRSFESTVSQCFAPKSFESTDSRQFAPRSFAENLDFKINNFNRPQFGNSPRIGFQQIIRPSNFNPGLFRPNFMPSCDPRLPLPASFTSPMSPYSSPTPNNVQFQNFTQPPLMSPCPSPTPNNVQFKNFTQPPLMSPCPSPTPNNVQFQNFTQPPPMSPCPSPTPNNVQFQNFIQPPPMSPCPSPTPNVQFQNFTQPPPMSPCPSPTPINVQFQNFTPTPIPISNVQQVRNSTFQPEFNVHLPPPSIVHDSPTPIRFGPANSSLHGIVPGVMLHGFVQNTPSSSAPPHGSLSSAFSSNGSVPAFVPSNGPAPAFVPSNGPIPSASRIPLQNNSKESKLNENTCTCKCKKSENSTTLSTQNNSFTMPLVPNPSPSAPIFSSSQNVQSLITRPSPPIFNNTFFPQPSLPISFKDFSRPPPPPPVIPQPISNQRFAIQPFQRPPM